LRVDLPPRRQLVQRQARHGVAEMAARYRCADSMSRPSFLTSERPPIYRVRRGRERRYRGGRFALKSRFRGRIYRGKTITCWTVEEAPRRHLKTCV
jgi:hypothetical protein